VAGNESPGMREELVVKLGAENSVRVCLMRYADESGNPKPLTHG